jgi:hypothetical protein
LLDFEVDADRMRNEVIRMLSGPGRNRDIPARSLTATASVGKPIFELDPAIRQRLAWVLPFAAVAFPLGVLVGWLIWG